MKDVREIFLPPNVNKDERTSVNNDKSSIILVGANGSGKTRMSLWMEDNIRDNSPKADFTGMKKARRISAQKSLNIPDTITLTDIEKAYEKLIYGQNSTDKASLERNKYSYIWNNSRETHLLNDYERLMTYLMSEHDYVSNKSRENKRRNKDIALNVSEKTKLETIIDIWEGIVLHRRLSPSHIGVDVYDSEAKDESQTYSATMLSDGEREIFYFIGQVICAEPDSLIIIDEPENHLHTSILTRLWNTLEEKRSDCKFLYITHNLDFAYSKRADADIIWVKSMQKGQKKEDSIWDYRFVRDSEHEFSEQLRLEVMGSRQKVLIVEGNEGRRSFDKRLYSLIYRDYNVIHLRNREEVRRAVYAYNEAETSEFHYKEVKGIVDRDRTEEDVIKRDASHNVYVPDVAIAENLFVCPDIVRILAKNPVKPYGGDVEKLCAEIKGRVIAFLSEHKEEFALNYVKEDAEAIIRKVFRAEDVKKLESGVSQIPADVDIRKLHDDRIKEIDAVISDSNIEKALKIINDKSLIAYTGLPRIFGFDSTGHIKAEEKTKEDVHDYIEFVINMLASEEIGEKLRGAFKRHFNMKE